MTVIEDVDQGIARPVAPGVLVEGPLVKAKLRDTSVSLFLYVGGSVAMLVWALTQGIGWVEVWVFAATFSLGSFGVGVMHRYFVHRSFRCGPVMRTVFAMFATMAAQGSIVKWVSNHRRHHLLADKPGDVHSPYYDGAGAPHPTFKKGMLHAQNGWVWDKETTDAAYYAKDILDDPIAMFFTRTRWYWYTLSFAIVPGAVGYAAGGVKTMIGCILFSGLFRSYLLVSCTSLVNSVCHSDGRFGYRRFDTDDGTTNELVTTFLTFGEGLHNNHHRFPRDAYISHAWYEVDINGLIFRGLAKLGLIHDLFDARTRHAAGKTEAEA